MRYTSSQNASIAGETVEVVAKFLTGATVTVIVYDLDDDSTPTLTSGTASEIASSGFYKWGSDDLDTQPTDFKQYLVVFTDDRGQTASQKVVVGGFPDQAAISQYQGAVYIDVNNGSSGSDFPLGTPTNPVDNEADARTIADNLGFTEYRIKGSITLSQDHTNWTFLGLSSATDNEVAAAGFDISNSSFEEITLSGAVGGSLPKNITCRLCQIDTVTGFDGVITDSGVVTSLGLETGGAKLQALNVSVDGLLASIDANGASEISWANLKGVVTFTGFTGGLLLLSADDAILTLDSGNTGGSAVLAGRAILTNNSSMTVLFDELISKSSIADAVLDEALSGHLSAGSAGEAINRLDADITSRQSEADAASRASTNQSEHDSTQSDIAALNNLSIADVQTALDNQGLTSVRAALIDNLDAAISSVVSAISALNDIDPTEVENAVWDAVASGHITSGSTGELLNLIDDIQTQQARTVCIQPTKVFVKPDQDAQVFVKPQQTAKVFVKETSP